MRGLADDLQQRLPVDILRNRALNGLGLLELLSRVLGIKTSLLFAECDVAGASVEVVGKPLEVFVRLGALPFAPFEASDAIDPSARLLYL